MLDFAIQITNLDERDKIRTEVYSSEGFKSLNKALNYDGVEHFSYEDNLLFSKKTGITDKKI